MKTHKAVVPVKCSGTFVLGIHEQSKAGNLGAKCPEHRIYQKHAAYALSLRFLVDGKTADPNCRQDRVTRQALRDLFG